LTILLHQRCCTRMQLSKSNKYHPRPSPHDGPRVGTHRHSSLARTAPASCHFDILMRWKNSARCAKKICNSVKSGGWMS
jgi:hypothetical protein